METSTGLDGRRRTVHGAHPGRIERTGHRRPVSQNTRQRRIADQSRPGQPVPGEGQTSGGQTVRRHRGHR